MAKCFQAWKKKFSNFLVTSLLLKVIMIRSLVIFAISHSILGYQIPKPFNSNLPLGKYNSNGVSMYFDDLHSGPGVNLFGSKEKEIIDGLKDWTKTNLLSPLHEPDVDERKEMEDIQYYTISSSTPAGILSSFFSILSTLGPIAPNTATFIALTSDIPYDKFKEIDQTIDITLPLLPTVTSLSSVTVTHYHPQFKNAPKLLYVGRHSPSPVFCIVGKGDDTEVFDEGITTVDMEEKEREESKGEAPPGSTGKLPTSTPTLIQRKTTLEHLYNRAASSSTVDELKGSNRLRNSIVRTVENKEEYVDLTREWIKEATSNGGKKNQASKTAPNPLTYLHDVNKWDVSTSTLGSDIWSQAWGIVNEQDIEGRKREEKYMEGGVRKYKGQNMWLESLTAKKTQYLTTVFITPKFFTFNAAEFKNFAVTLSSSMKRIGTDSFLVVFHPEYVGGEFEERRAPFPMVAVCREIKED